MQSLQQSLQQLRQFHELALQYLSHVESLFSPSTAPTISASSAPQPIAAPNKIRAKRNTRGLNDAIRDVLRRESTPMAAKEVIAKIHPAFQAPHIKKAIYSRLSMMTSSGELKRSQAAGEAMHFRLAK